MRGRNAIFASTFCFALWLSAAPAAAQYDDAVADASALPAAEQTPAPEDAVSQRAREGTRMANQLGRFKTTGDRLTFQPENSEQQILGLENLALERIGKVLTDRRDQAAELLWEVSGIYTEYRGTNYLLVTHAVLKTKANRTAPVLSGAAR